MHASAASRALHSGKTGPKLESRTLPSWSTSSISKALAAFLADRKCSRSSLMM